MCAVTESDFHNLTPTESMESLYNINKLLTWFLIFTIIKCQLDEAEGYCSDEFETDDTLRSENVLYVCTNKMVTNTTTVYFDTDRAPRFAFSTCLCTVKFTTEGQNTVTLDYKIEDTSRYLLTVTGFGTTFSHRKKNVVLSKNDHIWTFDINSTFVDVDACLRITNITQDTFFNARCYTSDMTPTDTPGPSSGSPGSTKNVDTTTDKTRMETSNINKVTRQTESTLFVPVVDDGQTDSGPPIAIIGGAIGGAVLLLIVAIIVVIVVVKRRKKTTKEENGNRYGTESSAYNKDENSDYYMTENAMYNVPVDVLKPISNTKQMDEYDEIRTKDPTLSKPNVANNVKKAKGAKKKMTHQNNVQEEEYNHLNEFSKKFNVTGNIYSSIGRRGSQPGSDIYNVTNNTHANRGVNEHTEHVYDTGSHP